MSRDYPQYKLRMSPELKDSINELAEKNKRSMNAEIVARLEESLKLETHPHKIPMDVRAADDWIEKSGLTPEQMGEVMKQLAFERIAQIIDNKSNDK
ncbi:Arc family DNA-binding protein [Psychrobacter urativorans]|uniref:Arc-like DNA binding domain-containing protein n=1 Tax=Psychrobacter urativorans TaxID=45610 RepID=A0A0M4U5P8_9GAMM|nr:Arc family DNA-binding protein [Psychrobacter urativorans]ALF60306.1 hypothetical protein AOC03_09875 [Psychrobacter urativorans]